MTINKANCGNEDPGSVYEEILLKLETTPGLSKTALIQTILADAPPVNKVPEGVWGNLYIRAMSFERAGSMVATHTHRFDHITMLSSGAVSVKWKDTQTGKTGEGVWKAPTFFMVKKLFEHEFTALEDNTLGFCVFSHRDPNSGEVVNNFNGYMAAYG